MALLIGVGVLVVIALIVIMLYNRLVAIRNQVGNAWKQIDVQLKRRHDLIPNLVEVVKDYMSYEQETLEAGDRGAQPGGQGADAGGRHAGRERALRRHGQAVRGDGGLSRPEGQPERRPPDGGADGDGEQDLLRPPVLQRQRDDR